MTSKKLGIALILLTALGLPFALLSGGCNGKTGASDDDAGNEGGDGEDTGTSAVRASLTIGQAGGTLWSFDGLASITIPPGALESDVVFTIVPVLPVPIADNKVVGGAYLFEPRITKLALPVTVSVPFQSLDFPPGANAADVRIMSAYDGIQFTLVPKTNDVSTVRISTSTKVLGTFIAVVPDAVDSGAPDTSQCKLMCEGPDDIDGGIGCNCGVTCNGVVYQLQCVCGACTCYQDGVAGKTTTLSVSNCNNGGASLSQAYLNVCGYPAAKNFISAGGPSSMDGGGSCP